MENNTNRSSVRHDIKSSFNSRIHQKTIFKRVVSCSLLGFGLFVSSLAFSAESVWRDIKTSGVHVNRSVVADSLQIAGKAAGSTPLKRFRALSLNESLLKERLAVGATALSGSQRLARARPNHVSESVITVPLPGGQSVRVRLTPNQVMAPELAARYPQIKTWDVVGVDDSAIRGVIDFTDYGFHAMLTMPDGDTVFVERKDKDSSDVYRSFSRYENKAAFAQDFHCNLHDNKPDLGIGREKGEKNTAARNAAPKLIRYRLAVAATGEYTRYHGSVRRALSAIVTTINRVNRVNARDLGVRFELINDEEFIIYTQPSNDPYSNNQADIMLGENILNLQDTLGRSRYDIGHVFTQGDPSGLAVVEGTCDENSFNVFSTSNGGEISLRGVKEAGVTGSPSPDGDAFDIDFVAHELGHQLGARHTFNSETGSCGGGNRSPQSAVEPGSGSTVMSYAGLCGSNDLQINSDDYYHTKSIIEILSYTRNDNVGSSCGLRTTTGNNNPEPDAKTDTVIPANTPFFLTGSASDPDGDSLSYVWEQMDTGTASDVDVDTGDNALIRSRPPSPSTTRFIPRLSDLFVGRAAKGEHLPVANRELNFSFVVRDGQGGIEQDNLKVRVSGTGQPFALSSHGFRRNLGVAQQTRVSWDVAGTNRAPINCRTVDISLIQVNGRRVLIKGNTANDGSETVTIPANAQGMSGTRMMVACHRSASTFFNIAKGDLRIVPQGQGESDSANNNGTGNNNSTGSGGSSDSGGGAFDVIHLVWLMLMALFVYGIRKQPVLKVRKIRVISQKNEKKRGYHYEK